MTTRNIVLYSQPGCGPCVSLKRALKTTGLDFDEVNVREDEVARDLIRDLGYQGTPVLVIRDEFATIVEHHGGFSDALRARLKGLAA